MSGRLHSNFVYLTPSTGIASSGPATDSDGPVVVDVRGYSVLGIQIDSGNDGAIQIECSASFALPWTPLGSSLQNVGCLVHPAPLRPGLPVDLRQGLPETQCPVADRQLWAHLQASRSQVQQQFGP